MQLAMELIDLLPNSMSFHRVTMLDLDRTRAVPDGFTGRIRRWEGRTIVSVEWYHNGLLHNPGPQTPAYRHVRPTGATKYEMFYEHGGLQDPNRRRAAVRGFFASGSVHYEERYQGGLRSDAGTVAAVTKWRQDGTLRHELHYRDGERVC